MKLFNQLKSLTVTLGALGSLAMLVGCGGDSDAPLSELYGIYELTDWTENEASCDAEGASVLADKIEKYMLVKEGEFLFVRFVSAETCESLESCRAAAEDETINLSGFLFESGSDSNGWVGSSASASGMGGDTCSGIFNEYRMTAPTSTTLELVRTRHDVADVGKDADDFCDLDEVSARGPNEPCVSRSVLSATFVEGI